MFHMTRLAMLALVVTTLLVAAPASTAAMDAQTATAPAVADTENITHTSEESVVPASTGDLRVSGNELAGDRFDPVDTAETRDRLDGDDSPDDVAAAPTFCESGLVPFTDNVGVVMGGNCYMIENEQLWIVGECGETATMICYGMTENDNEKPPTAAAGPEPAPVGENAMTSHTETDLRPASALRSSSVPVDAAAVVAGSGAGSQVPLPVHEPTGIDDCEFGYNEEDGWYFRCDFSTLGVDSPSSDGDANGEDDLPFPLRPTGPFIPTPQ